MCYNRTKFIFFFFQAEDGIRDGTVTGVQTCALPIYFATTIAPGMRDVLLTGKVYEAVRRKKDGRPVYDAVVLDRSEEHTSELQSQFHLVCRLLLEKKKKKKKKTVK